MKLFKTRTMRLAGVAGAAFLAAGLAMAQPGPMHGHGGPGGPGMGIEQVLADIKAQLNLNTAQQSQWDAIAAQHKAAHESARTAMQSVHAAMTAELAKAEPDLAAVAAAADAAEATARAGRTQVRDQWLRLYATFTPDQKTVVRTALQTRMAKMESFRAKMQQRMQSRQSGAGS
jgi:Spy/CpxP family protein refolding chaperone